VTPTWAQLIKAEPKLADLERRLKEVVVHEQEDCKKTGRPFCANAVWFGYNGELSFKVEFARLAGWSREGHPILGSESAYDAGYEHLYDSLPNCEHEGAIC
jgi:hypothetical protein